jgi:threonine dehydrogenase-like Zn-dependent dehydrogenase
MRTEPGSAAILRARVTHQIAPGIGARGGDALAIVEEGPLPAGSRIFVPGRLPCGECAACRRALCEACVSTRAIAVGGERRVAVPDRFIAPVDPALPPLGAIAAGLVADVIGAGGRAGLGAGDTAVWLGEPAWTRVGASWSLSRGARTFVLGPAAAPASSASAAPAPVLLALAAGPAGWRETIADAEAAGGPAGGRPERRIFVCGAGPDLARAALELVTPGSTLSFLRGAPPELGGLDAAPPLRLFTGGAGHPDLIPEALAAVSRGEVDTDRLFVEVSADDAEMAVADFRRGLDRPIPVVASMA